MPDTHALVERPSQDQLAVYDAIVVGAGISGMYMLYRLRELGMTVRVFEAGTNVGGTWYWNRYPGARFDSESWTYGYSFSKELMREWDWKEHFSPQPDTLEYLNYVADKFDLRRDIQFRSTVMAAHWDEAANQWSVTLEGGEQATGRFLFTAVGILSAYTLPGHCQLKQSWYARRVGGAAARVGELLCSPIMPPRSSRAGPEKGVLSPLT
jgi:cation diffusion facilitator CzcD-associated flavoprotein CzcO